MKIFNKVPGSRLLRIVLFSMALMCALLLSSCSDDENQKKQSEKLEKTQKPKPSVTDPQSKTPEPEPAPYSTELSIFAVGDIMMHSPQIPAGYDPMKKTYNYDSFFSEVKGILSQADWTIGNLETPLAGKELGYTGYPMFNAPAELADALKNAGFDILTTANNHSMDRKERGVLNTLQNLRARGLFTAGTASSQQEADKILLLTKNEISMAVLSYTYGTNGIPIPEGKEYLVSLINENKIVQDIARARHQGADLITVALHFGQEYMRKPNDQQKQLAEHLVKSGADLILGSHPHVVQPYQFIETVGTDGSNRKGLVIYSLGNFISNQSDPYTDYGVIFEVTVQKHFPDKKTQISSVETVPTWVHKYYSKGKKNYRVLPVEAVVTARKDRSLTANDYVRLAKGLNEMKQHLQSFTIPVTNPNP